MTLSRRETLKRVAAGALAASLAASAGRLTAPERLRVPGDLDHSSWLYDPGAVGTSPHNAFYALDLTAVGALEDELRGSTVAKYANYVDHPGLDVLAPTSVQIDEVLQVFPLGADPVQSVVISAGNAPDELRADLRRTFGGRTTYRGFDLYPADGGREAAVGVGDGHVLIGYPSGSHAATDVVRSLVDAGTGAADRYGEANPDFGRLLEALGRGHDVSGFAHPPRRKTTAGRGVFENAVATGHRYVFGTDTSRSRYVYVFATGDDADPAAVRSWVEENDGQDDRLFGAYETVEVSRRDRIVTVEGALPTVEI